MDAIKVELQFDTTLESAVIGFTHYKRVPGVGFEYQANGTYADSAEMNSDLETDLDTLYAANAAA